MSTTNIRPKHKPSPTAAFHLRKAIGEQWAYEIFTDHHRDRFDTAMGVCANYYSGQISKEQAKADVFSLLSESVLDYFADAELISDEEYNKAIMPGWNRRQAG